MADRMSFDKYIDNPSGGASVITNRGMYKDMYKRKFDAVLLREQGKIVYTIYKANDPEDSYYIHLKIPSEVIEKFYYDVIIRLHTSVNSKKHSQNLRMYAVQFYSNDPAFVYTFAHSFAKNKLFINDLSPKMSKQALQNRASIKNPKDEVWYVKSLYFAYLAMEKYNLFNRVILDRSAKHYDKKELISKIANADDKIIARQEAQRKLEKEKREEQERKNRERPHPNNINISAPTAKQSSISKGVKTSKRTKTTSVTKTSKITTMNKKS